MTNTEKTGHLICPFHVEIPNFKTKWSEQEEKKVFFTKQFYVSLIYPLYCFLYLKSGVTCFSKKKIFGHTLNVDSIFTEPLGLLELLFDDSLEGKNCKLTSF